MLPMPLPKFLIPLLALLLLLPAGCAKSPSNGSSSPVSGPQLQISMTVNGTLNPAYYYYVLFNVNNAPGPGGSSITGPVPVVFPPYGNGFAAGAFTNYVEYHGSQPGGTNFGYYGITSDLLTPVSLGQSRLINPQANGQTLSFQLPLAYLGNVTADNINDIEINFVATNIVPLPTDTLYPNKAFDALYQTNQLGNNSKFLTLIVRTPGGAVQSAIYQNSTLNIEPTGDVAVSDGNGNPQSAVGVTGVDTNALDISDFSIKLISQ